MGWRHERKIHKLRKKLDRSRQKRAEAEMRIESLKRELARRDAELASLLEQSQVLTLVLVKPNGEQVEFPARLHKANRQGNVMVEGYLTKGHADTYPAGSFVGIKPDPTYRKGLIPLQMGGGFSRGDITVGAADTFAVSAPLTARALSKALFTNREQEDQ